MTEQKNAMELRVPRKVLHFIDQVRGQKSRQAWIVSMLVALEERRGTK